MKAVFKVGGKQTIASVGDAIYVEKLNGEPGDTVKFNEVLMLDDKVGNPYIDGAVVEGTIDKQGKQKKIIVFKYRPKKKYRKTQGHRQPYTKLTVKKIVK